MPAITDDLDFIEQALRDAKRVAGTMRNGGLRELWYDLGFAIDRVERVRQAWKARPVQMGLFDGERREARDV